MTLSAYCNFKVMQELRGIQCQTAMNYFSKYHNHRIT